MTYMLRIKARKLVYLNENPGSVEIIIPEEEIITQLLEKHAEIAMARIIFRPHV